ncbi:GIY-YIG nuclease family protein [Mucilaginibacter sp.]|uniref:GIY-YIG nuclease family protein n=1 Tax=Mucilaginibacter sp. TaxID=1882438 RepID=UPI002ED36CE2
MAESPLKKGLFLYIVAMFTVYVLYSPAFNQIYIGYTSDLDNRFLSHNELATKGHTIKYRPWIIAYTEEFPTKSEALIREKQLKSSNGRQFIRKIIAGKFNTSDG